MKPLISTEEAKACIYANSPQFSAVTVPLEEASGRILREPILSDRPFPPFDRSMMDGYALRCSDIGNVDSFNVVASVAAGAAEQKIGHKVGDCAEIMTGAVVPSDADAIVPVEATERIDAQSIRLLDPESIETGDFIHRAGSDHSEGTGILAPGCCLGSREIAVAATSGKAQVLVSPLPRIVIVSTGDELVDIDAIPAPHQIRRSNDLAMATALIRAGLESVQRVHLPDDEAIVRTQLKALIESYDFVILSGGISMGRKDYIPEALDSLGLDCRFHGVRQKPGKPMGYWSNSNCGVFALPGNPLSTLSCLHHYVIPAIFTALGRLQFQSTIVLPLQSSLEAHPKLTLLLPVRVEGGSSLLPVPAQNSGDLIRILQSDGYIVVPPRSDDPYLAGTSFVFYPWF